MSGLMASPGAKLAGQGAKLAGFGDKLAGLGAKLAGQGTKLAGQGVKLADFWESWQVKSSFHSNKAASSVRLDRQILL